MSPQALLSGWLEKRLEAPALAWLKERCAEISAGAPQSAFFPAFGQALRHAGKDAIALSPAEQARASSAHPGWDLRDWSLADAARAALLLSLRPGPKAVETVLALHQTADLGEHVALVRALFLMPDARELLHVAREAVRSNMRDVFAAVSQRNPYPAEHADEIAWNQMVVKCLFVDLPLAPVFGLDRRRNPALAAMIVGLARERKAAKRALSPEAWRCVEPFAGRFDPETKNLILGE
jgi:hypothetical protein